MKAKMFNTQGFRFRFRSILVHSAWITIVGIVLFRLATANTQQVIYVEIFAISGAILATAPWVIQLLLSLVIIMSHNAGVGDLTWLVMPPSKESPRRQSSKAVDQGIGDGGVWIGYGNERGLISNGRNGVINVFGSHMLARIEGRNGPQPQLQRNRTDLKPGYMMPPAVARPWFAN
ncbi:hypothetical protein F0562_021819 [Nyssa sinensis]|uniref:Uncharacterized protein n=1 Tax=Nyssa sinensis TaxID=561372 RepID=A0A5J5BMV5_9ASTE|nr:hypothetical protein F0562_021819 [Nyssa sinensis]